jgi:hypothetical protein
MVTMNVVDQALNVVQRAETLDGEVTLTLDLELPEHRAALAAALAVLRAMGEDGASLLTPGRGAPDQPGAPAGQVSAGQVPADQSRSPEAPSGGAVEAGVEATGGAPGEADEAGDAGEDDAIRQSYVQAVAELTPDAERQARIVRDTFPRVRELLRDGANVAAVAQIQYRRWAEEHPST